MKQKLDEVRTLAIQLFNASRRQKKAHGPRIWHDTQWGDLPSESVAVWDAVAIEAYKRLKPSTSEAAAASEANVTITAMEKDAVERFLNSSGQCVIWGEWPLTGGVLRRLLANAKKEGK